MSVGTVSNALNHPEKVNAGTIEKVQDAIRDLGFVRNNVTRFLTAGTNSTTCFVATNLANSFFVDIARGAQDAALQAGTVKY